VPNVIWHVTMSLDGFIAGPADSMDWIFRPQYRGPNPQATEIVQSIGAILAGRRTGYDIGRQTDLPPGARKPYGGAWSGPVFVLTHHPPEDFDDDPSLTFLTCGVREAVATAAKAAGDKKVVIFGADLAQQCIQEGLVEEIFIHLLPVLLGDGIRLFGQPGALPVDLGAVSVTRAGQVTNLGFRILR
jgi:dihydrofolate reductase